MPLIKIYDEEEIYFKDSESAISYIKSTNVFRDICIYGTNDKYLYEEINKLNQYVKEYNKGKALSDQIILSNPYYCRAIKGVLGVGCLSIILNFYNDARGCITLTGWNDDVLDTSMEKSNMTPSLKALATISVMHSLWANL